MCIVFVMAVNVARIGMELDGSNHPMISSKKLTDLGFEFKFSIEDIIKETGSCCTECGFLSSS